MLSENLLSKITYTSKDIFSYVVYTIDLFIVPTKILYQKSKQTKPDIFINIFSREKN